MESAATVTVQMMGRDEGAQDRVELSFADAVRAAFDLLALESGYRCVEALPSFVRYESESLFLNIYHGRLSYEIDVQVGRLDEENAYKYRLADVLPALLGPDQNLRTYYQASTAEAVRGCVEKIASLVEAYYADVLCGDPETWARIISFTAKRNAAEGKELEQRTIRRAVDEAWKQRDYQKVCELYEPIRADLSKAEEKRLEYALKHR